MTTSQNPPNPEQTRQQRRVYELIALLLALFGLYYLFAHLKRAPLVVYCAEDSIFAEGILQDFTRHTGIPVAIRYDTEATNSLGLVELLLQEKEHPRCDVFWNNELLGTLQLADQGVLLPYKGSGFARIPDAFKDAPGRWTGFGARLRLWIINTNKLVASAAVIKQTLKGDLGRLAIATPLDGTTRMQYTILWQMWGGNELIKWHHNWRTRHVREADSNAAVKNLVAEGVCDLGFTDTDDFFEARDDGKPVAMLPVRLENGATICIPNTVSIIRGTPRLAEAQKLADYLLSAECEMALALGKSRQIPLGPVDEDRLPPELKQLKHWAADGYPLTTLDTTPQECLTWLKAEYLK